MSEYKAEKGVLGLDVRLTEGEREVMRVKARESGMDSVILYVERILSRQLAERDGLWRSHIAACDPWREPCGWCGKPAADPIFPPGSQREGDTDG